MEIADLKLGNKYSRKDLMDIFKNNSFMRGMNKCNNTNCMVLLSKHTKGRIYEDTFKDDLTIYTGEGLVGDQKMTGANKTLNESNETHLPVHLFVMFDELYIYYGLVKVAGDVYTAIENDIEGNPREVFKFPLKRINQEEFDYQIEDKNIASFYPISIKPTLNVVGAAIVKDNKVLIAKRKTGELKGKWEFPGGKIENGETPEQALKREIKEELDIDVSVNKLIDTSYYEYKDFNVNLSVYECFHEDGTINDIEHEELKWVDANKVDKEDLADADSQIAETFVDSLPMSINDEPLHFDYFESRPIEETDRQLRRAVQDYERSQKAKQRSGANAEQAVIRYEKDKLNNAGKPDLADLVKQVSKESSDYGYDILSFEYNNSVYQESHIEVKSAKLSNNYIEFFISENELRKFKNDNAYKIYCLFRTGNEYKLHIVNKNDFFANDYLAPLTYKVRIRIHQ